MTAPVLLVGLLILAALVVAFGAPVARRRRTIIVQRDRPVRRIRRVRRVVQTPVVQTDVVRAPVVQTPVVQTDVVRAPVVQTPVVEEIVEDRY